MASSITLLSFGAAFSSKKVYLVRTNAARKVRCRKIDDTRPAVAICAQRYIRQMYSYAPSTAARICTTSNPRRSAGAARDATRLSKREYCRRISRRGSPSRLFSAFFAFFLSHNRNRRAKFFFRQIVAWTRGSGGAADSAAVSWKKSGEQRRDRGAVLRDWVRATVARVCLLCCESILSEF